MQILAVVVLYKQLPEQSQTIQSLIRVFESDPGLIPSSRASMGQQPGSRGRCFSPFCL